MHIFLLSKKILDSLSLKERALWWSALSVASISAIALVILFVGKTTEVVPAQGGRHTEGVVGQPSYVNPVLASSQVDKSLVRLLFAPLTTIVEKIEPSEDGRVVRVRIKENLAWADGAELTSDDVVFTIYQIQDPETRSPLFSSWQGVMVSRGSKLEVSFRLATPYAFFIENLSDLYILPKHLFSEVPASNWRLSDYNLQPIGNGPYHFVSYEKRQDGFITAYKLERNLSYAGDAPNIAQFNIRFFANTEDAVRGFNVGQIDGMVIFDPATIDSIQRPFELVAFHSPTVYSVFWNQSQNLSLQSDSVRRALALAINRNEILASSLRGYGDAAYGPIPPALALVPESLRHATSSQEEAIAILESGGWKLNEEGIREQKIKNASVPLTFELLVPDVPFLIATAQALQNSWYSLGADVKIVVASPGEEMDGIIRSRNYQTILFGNSVRKNGDLFSFWHSSERFYPGLNLSLFNNKNADRLMDEARKNLNPEERTAQIEALQEVIAGAYPALFLYSPNYLYITSKDLQGLGDDRFLQDVSDRFSNVSSWFLKTSRVLK